MAAADPLAAVAAQLNAINATLAEASSINSAISSLGSQGWGIIAIVIVLTVYQVSFNHGFLDCATSPTKLAASVANSVSIAVTNTIQAHLSSSPSQREPTPAPVAPSPPAVAPSS